jgi:hypothetical protein
VYAKLLTKLGAVLATTNVGLDMEGDRDILYAKILQERETWHDRVCPVLLPEDSANLKSYPELAKHLQEWMEEAK